ncbi:hypothetical protein SAMN05216246_11217 [Actinomyces denticolens]|uniref:Uncharacterized protein n=1 Tax=Actinomyces denticolens TaxID=52767 RepID=A0ABY1IG81_9ACTO|nr:hypothetical protein SAMN05216246_11217 [Actinomyces denticolens]
MRDFLTGPGRRRVDPHHKRYYHNSVRFEFTASADKHGVPREDAAYAVLHHVDYAILQPRHPGEQSFMFVGLPHPHAMRHLEVGVTVDGRGRRTIFHAMEVTDLYRHLIPPTAQDL